MMTDAGFLEKRYVDEEIGEIYSFLITLKLIYHSGLITLNVYVALGLMQALMVIFTLPCPRLHLNSLSVLKLPGQDSPMIHFHFTNLRSRFTLKCKMLRSRFTCLLKLLGADSHSALSN